MLQNNRWNCVQMSLVCWILMPGLAASLAAEPAGVDFTNDIVPVLTKLGCNSGGCHGKATGRGGFKLSLFGFEARPDFDAIVHGSRGRRVFPAVPERSLLLRKATMSIPHGGGRRLGVDDPEYKLLHNWIEAEMPWGPAAGPRLAGLSVRPDLQVLQSQQELNLKVTAEYTDGTRRDVTRLARFEATDGAVAQVDTQGRVTGQGGMGESAIVIQYQGQVAVSRMIAPAQHGLKRPLAELPVRNFIDRYVQQKLSLLRIPPAELVDDATFLRRSTLQIAGRLPTLPEIRQFQAETRADKRAAWIETLLASSDYADHFAQKWSGLLRNKRRGQAARIPATIAFHAWIRDSIARNLPYDQFVRAIVTATGNVTVNPPAQWYAEVRYLDRYVDDTAQVFLGVRIGCARCHHHPFEKFSQDDYFGLAAFFGRVDRKGGAGVAERRADETIYVKPRGQVSHPKTGNLVAPCGLGAAPVEVAPYDDPRHHLVDWMAAADNPYFARAFVNRMWAHFFGRGLVEPMDDLRVTNPASNEPLLQALASEFVRQQFDMKHVVRLICNSSTYQLSSHAADAYVSEAKSHARYYPQRLAAEVLLDAVDQVTGVSTSYRGLPAGTRALQLPDENYSNDFLRLFGRPMRESACECERKSEPSLSQSLFALNDRFLLGKAMAAQGYAAQLAQDQRAHAERVRELFWVALVRAPSDRELEDALAYLQSENHSRRAYGNLVWALTNTKEFMYVH